MAAEVRERGRRAVAMPGDIRDFSEQLAAAAVEQLGRLDVWVNNAGGSEEKRTQPMVETPDDTWRAQLELNLTTVFQGASGRGAAHDARAGRSSTSPRAPACGAHPTPGPTARPRPASSTSR